MRNILLFSSYFYPYISGMTVYHQRILTALQDYYNFTVLTFCYSPALPQQEKIGRILIVRLPFLFRISKGFISPQSIYYFSYYLQSADIVINNLPNFEGLPLVIMAKILKKKVISFIQCKIELGKRLDQRFIQFFLETSVQLQIRFSDIILTHPGYSDVLKLTSKEKNKLTEIFPPVVVAQPNPVAGKKFKKLKKKEIWVGYVGRIAREKGLEYLINAIKMLKSNYPNLRLVIAGPLPNQTVGENEYQLYIQKLINENNIYFTHLGFLSMPDLSAFYRYLDLLVLPSVNHTEAFGIVQAESLLSGTPVIASDLPGVNMAIKLTKMGVLVKPKDSIALATGIKKIITNRKKYTSLQKKQTAASIFDFNKNTSLYRQLFDE